MDNDIAAKVRNVFMQNSGHRTLIEDMASFKDLELDSLDAAEISIHLEEVFHERALVVPDSEMNETYRGGNGTVADVIALTKKLIAQAEVSRISVAGTFEKRAHHKQVRPESFGTEFRARRTMFAGLHPILIL